MPTGYTAGILDGTIKDFNGFAKLCIRAFGATMHMRDDSFDVEYKKAEPGDYYSTQLEKAKQDLIDIEKLTDSEIIDKQKSDLLKSKNRHIKYIEDAKLNEAKLNSILKDVSTWIPPTDNHKEIKNFMINQINETIKFDCSHESYEEKLNEIELELSNLDASKYRESLIKQANWSIDYNTEHKEIKRCNEANEFVELFFNSLV